MPTRRPNAAEQRLLLMLAMRETRHLVHPTGMPLFKRHLEPLGGRRREDSFKKEFLTKVLEADVGVHAAAWEPTEDAIETLIAEPFAYTDGRGRTRKTFPEEMLGVPTMTQVDRTSVRRLMGATESALVRRQCRVLLWMTDGRSAMPEGVLFNEWVRRDCGRIFGVGFNLQNCKREVRFAALPTLPDYDIENCHIVLLRHLVGGRLALPTIDAYVAAKDAMRQGIASDTGCQIDRVKSAIIAMFYGMNPSSVRRCDDAIQLLGDADRVRAFGGHPIVRSLRKELDAARDLILKEAPRSPSGRHIVNAIGNRIPIGHAAGKRLAHVLQGLEASMLDAMIEDFDVALPCHDGWMLAQDVPTDIQEEQILRRTGLKVSIKQQRRDPQPADGLTMVHGAI